MAGQAGSRAMKEELMIERRAYTSEQWRALVDAAPAIARAVASVAGSQGQVETELGAFIALVDQAASDAPGGLLGSRRR
jgi:hypothetical protein